MDALPWGSVVRLSVKVIPDSRRSALMGYEGGVATIAVAAPADGGRANKELIRFVARLSGRKVRIVSGKTSHHKILRFD